jgi:LysR family transcriptional regulator, nitrogen assimilation regulatory protein
MVEALMDLRQLRYFVGIVQAGSLSRAADRLHVAQSALSHHLASLEAELGRDLVRRGPKGILLTEAGSALYRHAQAILRHIELAKQDAMSTLNVPAGRVSIGLPIALARMLSYDLFIGVRKAYPQILLHVTDGNSSQLRERLVNGRLDIALLYLGEPERGLTVEPLLEEELFYATTDTDKSAVRIAEVAKHPLLVPALSSSSHLIALEAFKEHGLTITAIGEINVVSALRRAVASGVGNAILSWAALCDDDRTLALNYRRFADIKLIRPVALCFSEVGQRTPAVEAIAETLKSLVRELVESGIWQGVSLIEPGREPPHAPISAKGRADADPPLAKARLAPARY